MIQELTLGVNIRCIADALITRGDAGASCVSVVRASRLGQSTAKALAVLDGVQTSEIFRVVLPRLDMELDEDRARETMTQG